MSKLTPEQWKRVEAIYESVMDFDPHKRMSYLNEHCGGDSTVRREIEAMLGLRHRSASFLEKPILDRSGFVEAPPPPPDSTEAGTLIGPWRLIQPIGAGGMGVVWLAERADGAYERQVALKLIKRGMDTEDILRRFHNERQVLANLEHPNIAHLLDGGATNDGRPYLVMEFIDGVPIDDYCDSHRLSIADRLRLFTKVCKGIQHAHRNLVVHRDLKPGNILVTTEGEPKLLDFGIAKLLNIEGSAQTVDFTVTTLRLMTPRYASPEQVRGEVITTASDIYSLGVILYELLTGQPPYDISTRARTDLEHAICTLVPRKPSTSFSSLQNGMSGVIRKIGSGDKSGGSGETGEEETESGEENKSSLTTSRDALSNARGCNFSLLRKQLAGDLDTIILKALRKEPERRYATVEQFSEDIQLHLRGLPVLARPDTWRYRSAKFVRRNRIPVAAMLTIAFIFIFASIMITVSYFQADEARQKAVESQLNEVAARKAETIQRQAAERARDEAEYQSYFANLNAAEAAIRDNDIGSARIHLDHAPPHLREWEWTHLHNRLDRSEAILSYPGEPNRFSALILNAQDTIVAAAGVNGQIYLWDTETREFRGTIGSHRDKVRSIAFSPDGAFLAVGLGDWTGGRRNRGVITLWDIATGIQISRPFSGHTDSIQSLLFTPDGKKLISASSDTTIRVWDIHSGVELRRLNSHTKEVRNLTLSPDGAELLSVGWDGLAIRWDLETWQSRGQFNTDGRPLQYARYSPDGSKIALGSGSDILLYYRESGKPIRTLLGHRGSVQGLEWHEEQDTLFSSSTDETIRVWRLSDGREITRLLGHDDHVNALRLTGDCRHLFSASVDGTVRRWDAATRDITTLPSSGWQRSISVTPEGDQFLCQRQDSSPSGTKRTFILFYDLESRNLIREIPWPVAGNLFSIQPSPDGSMIAGASHDKLFLVDSNTGEIRHEFTGHKHMIWNAAFSPDGRILASASHDKTARLWSVDTGEQLGEPILLDNAVMSLIFSPDNSQIILGNEDGELLFIDIDSRTIIDRRHDHTDSIRDLAFSPDGAHFASSSDDGTIIIWNLSTHEPLADLRGHSDQVWAIAFSPDGSRLASGSHDETIKLWDTEHFREVASFRADQGKILSLCFTPDNHWLISGGTESKIRLWDGGVPPPDMTPDMTPDMAEK